MTVMMDIYTNRERLFPTVTSDLIISGVTDSSADSCLATVFEFSKNYLAFKAMFSYCWISVTYEC